MKVTMNIQKVLMMIIAAIGFMGAYTGARADETGADVTMVVIEQGLPERVMHTITIPEQVMEAAKHGAVTSSKKQFETTSREVHQNARKGLTTAAEARERVRDGLSIANDVRQGGPDRIPGFPNGVPGGPNGNGPPGLGPNGNGSPGNGPNGNGSPGNGPNGNGPPCGSPPCGNGPPGGGGPNGNGPPKN